MNYFTFFLVRHEYKLIVPYVFKFIKYTITPPSICLVHHPFNLTEKQTVNKNSRQNKSLNSN